MKLGRPKPLWYDTVQANPPLSFTCSSSKPTLQLSKKLKLVTVKPVQKPPKLIYPEDNLRKKFYRDHPFEFDTPITVLEESSSLSTSKLDSEWAVQRQLQLMESASISESQAYTQACSEYFTRKAEAQVTDRLAREEQFNVQKDSLRPLSHFFDTIFLEEKEEIERNKAALLIKNLK